MSLGQQLEIPKLDVREVRWSQIVPVGRKGVPIPSDWCFVSRHSIVMPARMMGKLTVDEWRPLIASSVLFQKKLRRSVDWRWWLYFLLPTFLVLVASIAVAVLLQIYGVSLIVLLIVFPVIIVGNRHYGPYLKQARLDADSKASALTGKELFLEVLRKIDTMRRGDADMIKAEKRSRRPLSLPTLAERIDNLQGIPSTATSEAT
jgi:hypothetical protein